MLLLFNCDIGPVPTLHTNNRREMVAGRRSRWFAPVNTQWRRQRRRRCFLDAVIVSGVLTPITRLSNRHLGGGAEGTVMTTCVKIVNGFDDDALTANWLHSMSDVGFGYDF